MDRYSMIVELRDEIPCSQLISQALRFAKTLVSAGISCDESVQSRW